MVQADTVLSLSPTVSVLPLGEELTVFDAATGATLALNRTAADVLALLDGSSSVAQVVHRLSQAYETPSGELRAAVTQMLDGLLARETLRVVQPSVRSSAGT